MLVENKLRKIIYYRRLYKKITKKKLKSISKKENVNIEKQNRMLQHTLIREITSF